MNGKGSRKCIEEKEAIVNDYEHLSSHRANLEKERMLFERYFDKLMESFNELTQENDDLRAQLNDNFSVAALTAEIETLQKVKEHLRINILKAEENLRISLRNAKEEVKALVEENLRISLRNAKEEVKVVFEENRLLDEQHKKVAALTAEIETLQKDKEHLRINLLKAEEEVKALFEENRFLDEQHKKVLRKLQREKHRHGSENRPSACCTSSNGSPRRPLSPLLQQQNSPEPNKMHKT